MIGQSYAKSKADARRMPPIKRPSVTPLLDERDSNILRDVRAKIKTVADCYDIAPEYVVRVLLAAMGKSK